MPNTPPRYVHVDGYTNLVRDTYSMGVINTNTRALQRAKKEKEDALRLRSQEQQQIIDINTLRNEVTDLKQSVQLILQLLMDGNK